MQKVHPGHEVLSLFGIGSPDQALKSSSLTPSLLSAFFVVLLAALALGVAANTIPFSGASASRAATVNAFEPSAFIPGQFVSEQLTRGYVAANQ